MPATQASRRMGVEVVYDDSSVRTGVPRTQQSIQGLGKGSGFAAQGVGLLKGALGALGGVLAFQEVAQYTGEVARMAEQAGRSKQAVIALAGSVKDANDIIAAIQQAGDGAISRLDATGFAARALALGLADTAKEAALFTRTVTVLGASVGKDATESFDQLQLAIANLSFERLDSLGISASNVRVRFTELKAAGEEASEAFRLAVLEEASTRLATLEQAGFDASTGTEALTAAWNDLSLALGEAAAPSYQAAADGLAGITRSLADTVEASNQFTSGQNILLDAMRTTQVDLIRLNDLLFVYDQLLASGNIAGAAQIQYAIAASQREVATAFLEGAEAQGVSRGAAAALFEELTGLTTAYEVLAGSSYVARDAAFDVAIGFDATGAAAAAARIDVLRLKDALDAVAGAQMGGGVTTSPSARKDLLEQSQLRAMGVNPLDRATTDFELDIQQRAFTRMRREATELSRTVRGVGRAGVDAAKEAAKAFEQEFNRVGGFVGRALTFNTSVGENDAFLDSLGLRNQNASDELVRRIQDVADRASEGTRSPWLDLFPELDAATTDEIRGRALRLIDDLQSGLRTDLLNRDAVKADVMELIAADRQAKDFRDSITQELLASGAASSGELDKALTATLGTAGQTAGTEVGVSINNAILAEIEASTAMYEGGGFKAGVAFKQGVLRGAVGGGAEIAILYADEFSEAVEGMG